MYIIKKYTFDKLQALNDKLKTDKITIKPSKMKNKKISIFINNNKITDIGAVRDKSHVVQEDICVRFVVRNIAQAEGDESIASGIRASMGIGRRITLTNHYSLVVGDNIGSSGNGTITSSGGFYGSGLGLTDIPDGALSANIALLDSLTNNFTGVLEVGGVPVLTAEVDTLQSVMTRNPTSTVDMVVSPSGSSR